jgi:hypothetical protein
MTSSIYNLERFHKDLFNAMESRPNGGIYSGRALGNNANRSLWTSAKVKSFYDGVVTSHNIFFPEFTLEEFARLIICESMQESTGDYRLGVKKPISFKDHTSHGIIQVTPGSVLFDYYRFGQPIIDVNGKMILSPSRIQNVDLNDPGVSIVIFSWYTTNVVSMGVSINEWIHQKEWHIKTGKVRRDFGNCKLNWLAGPHNDRHTNGKNAFQDYYNRILDYFITSNFGTKQDFDKLIDRPLREKVQGVSNKSIDNRNTILGLKFVKT